jgi:hypothetical protein
LQHKRVELRPLKHDPMFMPMSMFVSVSMSTYIHFHVQVHFHVRERSHEQVHDHVYKTEREQSVELAVSRCFLLSYDLISATRRCLPRRIHSRFRKYV